MRLVRRIWDDLPMWFAYGVGVYFAVAALGMTIDVPAVPRFDDEETAAAPPSPSTTVDPVRAGAIDVRVTAFRIGADRAAPGTLEARMTLELDNTSDANVDFHPSRLALRNARGDTVSAEHLGVSKVTIPPHLPQALPATFQIDPVEGASYTLLYGDQELFTGRPF